MKVRRPEGVNGDDAPDNLVEQLRQLHEALEAGDRDNFVKARRIGELLERLRKKFPPRAGWLKALEKTGIPQQRAQEYRDIFKESRPGGLLPDSGNIGFSEALRIIREGRKAKEGAEGQDDAAGKGSGSGKGGKTKREPVPADDPSADKVYDVYVPAAEANAFEERVRRVAKHLKVKGGDDETELISDTLLAALNHCDKMAKLRGAKAKKAAKAKGSNGD
jgi:hypothetical protein